jgi:hypothetical protein
LIALLLFFSFFVYFSRIHWVILTIIYLETRWSRRNI